MKKIAFVALICLLLSCRGEQPSESVYRFYKTIPKVSGRRSQNAPFPPVSIPEAQLRLIQHAEEARDLFPVDHWVMLEVTDKSLVGNISKVIEVKDTWVVMDKTTNRILKYDGEGRFLGLIGSPGQGPGEYLNCINITRVLGDKIAVEDGMRGMLLVYDLDGTFIKSTTRPGTQGDGGKFIIISSIIWNQMDRLYLADFSVDSATVPQHVALDYSQEYGKLLFGFGEREAYYQDMVNRYRVPRNSIKAFEWIHGRIWSASPITAQIHIYEPDGQLYRTVAGSHPNYVTEDDYQDVEPSKQGLLKLNLTKMRNYRVFAFENIVIQYLTGGRHHRFNIYDLNGNLLRSALKIDNLSTMIQTSTDIFVVGTLDYMTDEQDYHHLMNEDEMKLLTETGWTLENSLDSNPILCLRRPSWQ